MKKIQIVEAVIDYFESDQAGERKMKLHPEMVKVHLNNLFNKVVYNTWLNAKQFSDYSQLDAWSRVYELNVINQVGQRAVANLPFPPMQLPNNAGVRQVSSNEDPGNVFAPIENTANVVFNELEVSTLDSTPTYSLQQRVTTGAGDISHYLVLEKMPLPGPSQIVVVDALLIVPMEQMDDYDDVVIPGMEEETIVTQLIDVMQNKRNPDTANDNVITNQ